MIIPSKQVLLISVPDKKEVFMFDPKTACVLQTYSTQSELASTAAYFDLGQQFLIPHLNNTYVNMWDTDAREPKKFSVGDGEKITSLRMLEGNILLAGSSHGILYVYELPSGVLIRRAQLHSQSHEIKSIIFLKQMGYLVTGTKKQLKLWPLRDIIGDEKPVAEKTIHSVIQIISVQLIRNILCVLTQKTVSLYYACNFSVFTLNKDLPQIQNATCSCSSGGSLFVGDAFGKIKEVVINPHEKDLTFQQRKGRILLQGKKPLEIQTKEPISALVFVDSLQYLIAANYKGEVKIWNQGNLKNSVQLAKSSINLMHIIPRPSKDDKIPQSRKIKSLHKQQLTKVDQPIFYVSGNKHEADESGPLELSEDIYLERMLNYLNDKTELLESEIEMTKKQNKALLEANMHYFAILDQEEDRKPPKKTYM